MIERGLVDGKMATISYFDDSWTPRDKDPNAPRPLFP
jgi:hypothetical protein